MRKVKLLALLLAALMVVAAFAGCADTKEIESDVADLDDRVSALEDKIDNVASGVEDLKDAEEELKVIQDALKAQEEASKALLEEIKKLQEDLKKTEDKVDEIPAADEGLEQAMKDAAADIAARKAVYENNKADYTSKDYEAILTILEVAKTGVAAATKSADVKAIVAQMDTDLAKYTAYDDQLYIYVTKLLGNISAASKDLNDEAQKYLAAAVKHYGSDLKPITEYVFGQDKDGEDRKINLQAVLGNIDTLQTGKVESVSVVAEIGVPAETYYTLYNVTNEATAIDKEYARVAAKEVVDMVSENAAGKLYNRYTAWLKKAEKLGAENVKLLAKKDEIVELAAMVKNISEALTAYGQLGDLNYKTYTYDDVLLPYTNLADSKLIDVVVSGNTIAVKKNVYDKIDATIEGWKTTYGFDDDFAAAVIAEYYGDDRYEDYVADRDFIGHMEAAYSTFVKDIVDSLKAVNGMTALKADQIEAYLELEAAIAEWRVVVKEDVENEIEEVAVDEANFRLMLARQDLLKAADADVLDDTTKAPVMKNIVVFEDEENKATFEAFFGEDGTYADAKAYAAELRKSFKKVNDNKNKYTSLAAIYAIEGVYKKVASVVEANAILAGYKDDSNAYNGELDAYIGHYVDSTEFTYDEKDLFTYSTGDTYNLAGFEALYGEFGLDALLETVPAHLTGSQKSLSTYESAKATVEKNLENAVAGYADVVKAINAIGFQKAWTTATNLNKYGEASTAKEHSSVEIKDATVVYLVNLDDKAAVEAAVKARSAWEEKYLGGKMMTLEEVVDPTTKKVISGAYDLVDIADAHLDGALDKMALKIADLTKAADSLIKHLEAIADALAFVKTEQGKVYNFVSTDLAALQTNVAVTGYSTYNDSMQIKHYRINALGSDGNYAVAIKGLYEGETNPEDLAVLMGLVSSNEHTVAIADLLEDGYLAYQRFTWLNDKYTDTTEATGENTSIRYFKESYLSYAPVEDAIKTTAELDLAYAKAKVISIIEGYGLSDTDEAGYVDDAKAATSYSALSKILSAMVNATSGEAPQSFKIFNTSIAATKAVN